MTCDAQRAVTAFVQPEHALTHWQRAHTVGPSRKAVVVVNALSARVTEGVPINNTVSSRECFEFDRLRAARGGLTRRLRWVTEQVPINTNFSLVSFSACPLSLFPLAHTFFIDPNSNNTISVGAMVSPASPWTFLHLRGEPQAASESGSFTVEARCTLSHSN